MINNPVLEAIYNRRSIRKYEDKALDDAQIGALVEAALRAPSAMNFQPWHLTVVTDRGLITRWEQAIVQHFIDANNEQIIAHMQSRDNKVFYDAPAVFVISMEQGKEMDVGIMAQNITVAAKGLGLGSVVLGFPRAVFGAEFTDGYWQSVLKFPAGFVYGISVAVGYGAEPGRERQPDLTKVSYVK